MNAIALHHICKSFGSFAIDDLTLEVPEGTICGLVGENGAGKSTTIRLLMNALRPDSGTAAVLGVDTASRRPGGPGDGQDLPPLGRRPIPAVPGPL